MCISLRNNRLLDACFVVFSGCLAIFLLLSSRRLFDQPLHREKLATGCGEFYGDFRVEFSWFFPGKQKARLKWASVRWSRKLDLMGASVMVFTSTAESDLRSRAITKVRRTSNGGPMRVRAPAANPGSGAAVFRTRFSRHHHQRDALGRACLSDGLSAFPTKEELTADHRSQSVFG